MTLKPTPSSIEPAEVSKFNRLAQEWWDPQGPLKSLHEINPLRLKYIRDQICSHFQKDEPNLKPYEGLKILDVGCGGGLLSEPLATLGAQVTGIDAAKESIEVAHHHGHQRGLTIDYRSVPLESLLPSEAESFDAIMALEIVEHVQGYEDFLKTCLQLLKPGGLLIISTLNRTLKSYALGIVAAEYVLRWVPRGTHEWGKFLKPSEVARPLHSQGALIKDITGMSFNPLSWSWVLGRDLGVNYFLTACKPVPTPNS